jgi:cytoskeletal protein CcmA (bactofilin family)
MFSSQSNSKDKAVAKDKDSKPAREASNTPSIISSDVKITGDLHSPGEVKFDGTIEGDLACGTLTVGEHAQVTGSITADRAMIHGTIKGSIRARIVHLHNTARLEGDVVHEDLTIDSGAFIDGRCLHVQNPLEGGENKTAAQNDKKSGKGGAQTPENAANGQDKSAEHGETQLNA